MSFTKSKIIVLIVLVILPFSVFSTNFYVSNVGADNNNGQTPGTSWATLAKVNGYTFSPGDSILFKRGDTFGARLLIPGSGTATGGYITFGAYGVGNLPVFDGTGVALPQNHGLIRGESKNYIVVQDIRVQNVGIGAAKENTGIGFYGGTNILIQRCEVNNIAAYGIFMNSNSNVSILYNDVSEASCFSWAEQIALSNVDGFEIAYNESHHDGSNVGNNGGGSGIDAKGGSRNGTIHHNEVHDITTPLANGIYVDPWLGTSYNIQVYNNYVYNIEGGNGIALGAEQGGTLYNVTVHHNIIENSRRSGLIFHDEGTTGNPIYDIYVYNNTFYQNGTNGIAWYGGIRIFDSLLESVTFKNNIFADAYNFQIGYDATRVQLSDIVMDYNVVYGTSNLGAFTPIYGTNAITGDPLFTDAANNNFTLQGGSSAINAGDNSVWQGIPNIKDYDGVDITDSNGNIIVPGGTVSCGALEFIDENTSSLLYPAMDKTFALNIQNQNIIFTTDRSGELTLKVFDFKGVVVMNHNAKVIGGDYPVPIQLSAGVYLVRMEFGGQFLVKKFSVVH